MRVFKNNKGLKEVVLNKIGADDYRYDVIFSCESVTPDNLINFGLKIICVKEDNNVDFFYNEVLGFLVYDKLVDYVDGDFYILEEVKSESFFSIFGNMKEVLFSYKRDLIYIILISIFIEILLLLSPFYIKFIANQVYYSNNFSFMIYIFLFFVLILIVQIKLYNIRANFATKLEYNFNNDWFQMLFNKIIIKPFSYFEKRSVSNVASNFWSATYIQKALTSNFLDASIDGLLSSFILLFLYFVSPELFFIPLLFTLLYIFISVPNWRKFMVIEQMRSYYSNLMQAHMWETISGIFSIKIFQKELIRKDYWFKLFSLNNQVNDINQKIILNMKTFSASFYIFERLIFVSISAYILSIHDYNVSIFFMVVFYNELYLRRSLSLVDNIIEFSTLKIHFDKVNEMSKDCILYRKDGFYNFDFEQGIIFDNLTFGYSNKKIIKNFNFTIRNNDFVGIYGASGSGKTSLLRLILGIEKPTSGNIFIFGQKIDDTNSKFFLDYISTMTPKDHLFTGTILENISFFDNSPDIDFLKKLCLEMDILDTIESLDYGFNTVIKDDSFLSAGQRQRLLLIRALYKRPKILILDEATNNLDETLERKFISIINDLNILRIFITHNQAISNIFDYTIHMQDMEEKQIKRKA